MQISYKIKIICAVSFLLTGFCASAQELVVVKKIKTYQEQVENDSMQKMIELKSLVEGLVYDLRYSTTNNFTGQKLYRQGKETFMRFSAAKALATVQNELKAKGMGLKIFDAYRPHSATKKMWELIRDERYVANPSKGSGHNRGLAVDLTIIQLNTGIELNMGTGFDHFTDTAHHNFKNLSQEILSNRRLLKKTMENAGFKSLDTEWWHYSWPNDRNYQVLDIDFRKLRKEHD